jgi:hypothetical protein
MNRTTKIVKGKIDNFKRVATRTSNSMATFNVGKTQCKAFGKGAETLARWIAYDPNSAGEFEGYFETHSVKFGEECVAVHGKAIENHADNTDRFVSSTSGVHGSVAALAAAPSSPTEPIPAKEPIGLKTDLAAKEPSTLPEPTDLVDQ